MRVLRGFWVAWVTNLEDSFLVVVWGIALRLQVNPIWPSSFSLWGTQNADWWSTSLEGTGQIAWKKSSLNSCYTLRQKIIIKDTQFERLCVRLFLESPGSLPACPRTYRKLAGILSTSGWHQRVHHGHLIWAPEDREGEEAQAENRHNDHGYQKEGKTVCIECRQTMGRQRYWPCFIPVRREIKG